MNALKTEATAPRCYEITFEGRKHRAIGIFYQITACRFASSPDEAIRLLAEPLPQAYERSGRPPEVREIPSPFAWTQLYNSITNTRSDLDTARALVEGLDRLVRRVAERSAREAAAWHDAPDDPDHALYHGTADQMFPAEMRLTTIAELVAYIVTETPAGLRICDRLRLPDDPEWKPAPVASETMNDDHDRPCTEIRVLPVGGGGNALVGRQSYEQEITFRRDRNRELNDPERFELPAWDDLRVHWKAGEGLKQEGAQ